MDELNLGVLLFVPYREMERRVFAALTAGGHAELTPAKARLVARIGTDGSRLTDLAAQAQVTKQTASTLADQLVRAGYLERVPDPTDGRARLFASPPPAGPPPTSPTAPPMRFRANGSPIWANEPLRTSGKRSPLSVKSPTLTRERATSFDAQSPWNR